MGSETLPKLPTINFSEQNLSPGTNSWFSTCIEVQHALEEYGRFVAVFDEVTLEIHNAIFRTLKELFDLPTETKIQNTSHKPYHGYVGQLPFIPLHESLGINNSTTQGVQSFTKIMWPAGNQHFYESVDSYSMLLAELQEIVMRMVLESYGIKDGCDSHIGSTTHPLLVMKNQVPEMPVNNVTFPCHTDKSFTTILPQKQVGGLEIETKDGNWIAFEPPSPLPCVIAGDAFMAWSNGRIHSPNHQVVARGNEERYSLGAAFFQQMDNKNTR
ncbi:unnamed protein product, partial [Vitis vinifera]|uniref:Fe2OG dioxygenase domain-containing protein n=1 Tax=Vitis vinifera TaxID=29760 RepID=D7U0Q9_VITVI